MAMTYTILTSDKDTEGSIKYFVRHSIVPSASILTSAQSLIYSMLRVREMKTLIKGTILTGAYTLTLPTDFLESISLWLGGNDKSEIDILDEHHFETRVGMDDTDLPEDGTPTVCTMDKTKAYFDATADRDYLYRMWYMATPAELAVANQTNFMTTRYPHILEAMCKYYAYQHREMDGEATKWLGIAKAAIDVANGEYDMFKQSIRHEIHWGRS